MVDSHLLLYFTARFPVDDTGGEVGYRRKHAQQFVVT